jgi:Fe-S oxidoreductase
VVEAVEAARKDLNAAGHAGEIHKKIAGAIAKFGNPFGEEASRREVLGGEPHQAEIAYFTGCTAAYRSKETSQAGISILNKLGVDYTLLDEVCCGTVLARLGFPDEDIERQVNANIDAIAATGAKTVIFSCSGCYRMFKKEYPRFRELPFKAMHFTEWLAEQDLKLKPYEKTITYHDPCHIGRHMDLYDAPRDVIKKIPGATYVEMKDNRNTARCCGGGGGVRANYPELSSQIAAKRIEQAEIADVLVTACPFCVNNLKVGKENLGAKVEIRDLVEVIDELLEE